MRWTAKREAVARPAGRELRLGAAVLLAALVSAGGAEAETLAVANTNDSGTGSLRDAIGHANDGDTIVFASGVAGTITLTSGELVVKNSVDIEGPGAGVLAVSGNGTSRVFHLAEGITVTIAGLTITHGRAGGKAGGGGILNVGSTLILANDVFSCNEARHGGQSMFTVGGGVAAWRATLVVTDSAFVGNRAVSDDGGYGANGGGIFVSASIASVTRCTLTGNQAVGGAGGVANNDALTDVGIALGGGVVSKGTSTLTVEDSTFTGNQALGGSGGDGGTGLSFNSVGSGLGGGIVNFAGSTLVLTRSKFTCNQAIGGSHCVTGDTAGFGQVGSAGGGGLLNVGTAAVTSSTFECNRALGGSFNSAGRGFNVAGLAVGGAIMNASPFGTAVLDASDLTLTNNRAVGGVGNTGGPFPGDGVGGGAGNYLGGVATIRSSTFDGNQAIGGAGSGGSSGSDGLGGGVANITGSTLTLDDCALGSNEATGGAGGGGAFGGGIFDDGPSADPSSAGAPSTLGVGGSTIAGNEAAGGDGGGLAEGGGVYIKPGGVACADAATIAGTSGNSPAPDVVGSLPLCGP
jgi:hypothetical protein